MVAPLLIQFAPGATPQEIWMAEGSRPKGCSILSQIHGIVNMPIRSSVSPLPQVRMI
jgi:hypothetical protein